MKTIKSPLTKLGGMLPSDTKMMLMNRYLKLNIPRLPKEFTFDDFTKKDVLVRIDGMITLPLIDDVRAAGLTPIELKKDIETKLKDYIDTPTVSVTVAQPKSQRFYILGEISNTGEYTLLKQLTVLQAFALAGGFTEWAAKKEIILLRTEGGKEKIYRVNYKDIAKGTNFSQNILIKADDTIIVP